MAQLVFIHGPGAGGCADAFYHQLRHFPGSVAPNLPGHLSGTRCPDVARYVEWVRGWLWAQQLNNDLVLCGYTLGAAIALQYGLDYPDEVRALALMTATMKANPIPVSSLNLRLRAARADSTAYKEWLDGQRHAMKWVEAGLRETLMERHQQVGPLSQYHDLVILHEFDVHDRVAALRPKLLLIRGTDDTHARPNFEREIHESVPGSIYVELPRAGHFPASERPEEVNRLLENFIAGL